jgi:ATP-dependent RNA helicase DDX35
MRKRYDLRVIISSATMDAEHFKVYFGTNEIGEMDTPNVILMSIEGRTYPVGESIIKVLLFI